MYNHQLDTFVRVAELGSFGRAAEALYLSTPSVVQQINLLEAHCGFKLLERSNRGVKLTPAGQGFYEDAKTIIKLSGDALARGRAIADTSERTVRIGTALLFRCYVISQVWPALSELAPDMKMEIVPIPKASRAASFEALGVDYDVREGILSDISWADHCRFEELTRLPLCCAVAPNHRFYGRERLTLRDLDGETIVTVASGASKGYDALRADLLAQCPNATLIDSMYFDVDTFTLCEMNGYVLITVRTFTSIHPGLRTIPLDPQYTLPYGLIYSKTPSMATKRFLSLLRQTGAKLTPP